jgi:hypothetical protein
VGNIVTEASAWQLATASSPSTVRVKTVPVLNSVSHHKILLTFILASRCDNI